MRYKSKSDIVEGYRFLWENSIPIMEKMWGHEFREIATYNGENLNIKTLEGNMTIPTGWWVVKRATGGFYSYDDDTFQREYIPIMN